jgi:hypothetical protein
MAPGELATHRRAGARAGHSGAVADAGDDARDGVAVGAEDGGDLRAGPALRARSGAEPGEQTPGPRGSGAGGQPSGAPGVSRSA